MLKGSGISEDELRSQPSAALKVVEFQKNRQEAAEQREAGAGLAIKDVKAEHIVSSVDPSPLYTDLVQIGQG